MQFVSRFRVADPAVVSALVSTTASGKSYRLAGGSNGEKRPVQIALIHTGQSTRDEGGYVLLAHFQECLPVINQELYEFTSRGVMVV